MSPLSIISLFLSAEFTRTVEAVPYGGDGSVFRRPGDLSPGHCEGQAAGAGGDGDGRDGGGSEGLEEYPGDCGQYYQVRRSR